VESSLLHVQIINHRFSNEEGHARRAFYANGPE
jgi:hypothetical protein